MLSLINDVLDMSRIESGSVRIEYTTVHLPDILHDLRTIIQGSVHSKQQDLYIDTQDVIHEDIITDKLRLTQVLLNICSNAVKFTPVGGMINIRVSEKPCRRDGYITVVFSVKDNGIGMSREFRKHVFDSFSREHTVTENGIGGTGLGMAITDQIVRLMGGEIVIDSMKGRGSDFTVYLTLPIAENQNVDKQALEEERAVESFDYQGMHILMAEDNEVNAEIAVSILEMNGAKVDTVVDGQQAIEQFEVCPPGTYDFILMDIQMPVMHGRTASRAIRAMNRPDAKTIPIFALSADAFVEDQRLSAESGMNGHFSKPIDFEKMKKEIGKILIKGKRVGA